MNLTHNLPALLAEIADVVTDATGDATAGLAAALAIAKARGGQRVRILPEVKNNEWLIAAVGVKIAAVIVGLYSSDGSGEQIDIPMGDERGYMSQRRSRRQVIEAGLANGDAISRIAREAECTERYVFWFKAKQKLGKPDSRQLAMF